MIGFFNTVKPLVSDHPKCQTKVVAYWRWSFTGGETAKALIFSYVEAHIARQRLYHV